MPPLTRGKKRRCAVCAKERWAVYEVRRAGRATEDDLLSIAGAYGLDYWQVRWAWSYERVRREVTERVNTDPRLPPRVASIVLPSPPLFDWFLLEAAVQDREERDCRYGKPAPRGPQKHSTSQAFYATGLTVEVLAFRFGTTAESILGYRHARRWLGFRKADELADHAGLRGQDVWGWRFLAWAAVVEQVWREDEEAMAS
jgi:hypothetical protein